MSSSLSKFYNKIINEKIKPFSKPDFLLQDLQNDSGKPKTQSMRLNKLTPHQQLSQYGSTVLFHTWSHTKRNQTGISQFPS